MSNTLNLKKDKIQFKQFLSLENVSSEEILEIISTASELKNMRAVHEPLSVLKDKYILLVTKPSLPRSSITFQIAIKELGGEPVLSSLSGENLEQLLCDEHYIKALSSCGVSAVLVCTSKREDSNIFKNYISVPVINATAVNSPSEALSTFMTVYEVTHTFKNVKFTLVGNFNSDDNSLLTGLVKLGADVTVLPCENGQPQQSYMNYLSQYADVKIVKDKTTALKNADFVYFSSGDNSLYINKEDFADNDNYKVLSSVPTDKTLFDASIINNGNSLIDKQTENLLHVGKALLALLVSK